LNKRIIISILLTIVALIASIFFGFYIFLVLAFGGTAIVLSVAAALLFPALTLPMIWMWSKRNRIFKIWIALFLIIGLSIGAQEGIEAYKKSKIIDTAPNIVTSEYLPFIKDTKIVKIDNASLKLEGELPIIDGAAAVFPVYSAFVHATYPNTTKLYDGVFEYNNTVPGYEMLAEGKTDIFFGAKPSKAQSEYANELGKEFVLTQVGTEAFVFFVHKNNPITNLTTEQIKGIYSGEITNWKDVGGKDEKIVAYQRNEGSGSQSMLQRFMGDTPIMEAPTEQVNDMMVGIINQVADYRSSTASIGFSFRYYVEGIIKNPEIKLVSIDGIAPTIENIKNGTYPIITSLYAVTTDDQTNENVQLLIDWVLSEEGQKIIEETGYTGVK
jgi:phosphate transport system substrate-binding protein